MTENLTILGKELTNIPSLVHLHSLTFHRKTLWAKKNRIRWRPVHTSLCARFVIAHVACTRWFAWSPSFATKNERATCIMVDLRCILCGNGALWGANILHCCWRSRMGLCTYWKRPYFWYVYSSSYPRTRSTRARTNSHAHTHPYFPRRAQLKQLHAQPLIAFCDFLCVLCGVCAPWCAVVCACAVVCVCVCVRLYVIMGRPITPTGLFLNDTSMSNMTMSMTMNHNGKNMTVSYKMAHDHVPAFWTQPAENR